MNTVALRAGKNEDEELKANVPCQVPQLKNHVLGVAGLGFNTYL